MKHIGMKIFIVFLVIASASQSFAAYISLDYDEQWQGTCLWLPAKGVKAPDAHIDSARWVSYFPGSWGQGMVTCSMASLANSGIKNFYWDVVNEYGMVLYPSKVAESKIYRNQNSAVDFCKTDMVQIAIDVAKFNSINLKLVVYSIDDNNGKIVKELLEMYPGIKIVVVGSERQYKDKRVEMASKEKIASMLDATNRGKDPTKAKIYNNQLTAKYLHSGKILFKKEFAVYNKEDRHLLAVAAREKWTVFVNGKLIGAGKWYGGKFQDVPVWSHTYELDDVIKKGKNDIVVCAEATKAYRIFIANIRAGDMIYPCDGSWQATVIDKTPTPQDFDEIMDKVQGDWSPALQLGRPNVCPTTIGTILWNRIEN